MYTFALTSPSSLITVASRLRHFLVIRVFVHRIFTLRIRYVLRSRLYRTLRYTEAILHKNADSMQNVHKNTERQTLTVAR